MSGTFFLLREGLKFKIFWVVENGGLTVALIPVTHRGPGVNGG